MARILINTFGSYGDLHPYFAIALELKQRSHVVTIATCPLYRDKVITEGLEFLPVRPDIPFDDTAFIEKIFDAKQGGERVIRFVTAPLRETYDDLLPAVRATDVVITHPTSCAAAALAEQFQKPWVSTVLAPFSFFSALDPPVVANAPWLIKLRGLGPAPMRWVFTLARMQSRAWVQPVLHLRRELGLPVTHPLFEGQHSPQMVLGLFSPSMATPQADWPTQTVVTGFPFFDRHHEQPELDPAIEKFFNAGPAPIVFTLGSSAVTVAGDFYRESLIAVESLGVRALFLTGPFGQDLPVPLPDRVLAIPYAPHSAVFPRASLIVHQGGVGTTGQAMRSGRPSLVVPFGFDQFDNGERLRRLGTAEVLPRTRYNAARAQSKLLALLTNHDIATSARQLGVVVRAEHGAIHAADAIENTLHLRTAS
jgi:UDP:flavonoid glycosyltransferase YjiC (YdhE family)